MLFNNIFICLLADEKELQERLNRSVELDVKTEQLKSELQEAKEATMTELQRMTESTMAKINASIEEARRILNDAKAEALNISRQGESAVVTHTHTLIM